MLYSKVLADKLLAADEADTSLSPLALVKTFPSYNDFPVSGSVLGTKALAIDTNILYIWLGAGNSFGWYPLQYKTGFPEFSWDPLTLTYTLDNPNAYGTQYGDYFGAAVAVDGEYALVGAYGEADTPGTSNSGKVYVFSTSTGSLLYTFTNPNPVLDSQGDYFSRWAVDVSGNYGVVGAFGERVSSTETFSGAAYIYDLADGSLLHSLLNPNSYGQPTDDQFGYSVAISGDYVVVGAPNEDAIFNGESRSNCGIVYVYDVATGALILTLSNPKINATTEASNSKFGTTVAIDGDHVIVGAPFATNAGLSNVGTAFIFNVNTGALIHTIESQTPTESWSFASRVGISGNYAVISSANAAASTGELYSGRIYVYDVASGVLLHTLENPNAYSTPYADFMGILSIDGLYCAVGATGEDGPTGNSIGIVYIFDVETGQLVKTISNPDPLANSGFGGDSGVGISGGTVLIGSNGWTPGGGTNVGRAYIFKAS